MKILVTGASGFLGATLVRRLSGERHAVRVLLRPDSRRDLLGNAAESVEIAIGDVTDVPSVADALKDVDRVFHCAAHVGLGDSRSTRKMTHVNVHGTAVVLNEAVRAGVSRLVHVSSVAALGRTGSSDRPVDENAEWQDGRSATAYGRTKYLSELEVHRAIAEGLDAVIVNPSLVFGPGRPGENTMRIVEAVRDGRVPGYPVGATHVVDADDVTLGMIAAMDRGTTGSRYILAGDHLSWRDILGTIGEAYGVRVPDRRLSPTLMQLAASSAEAFAFLTRSEPRLTRESARLAAASRHYDSSRARAELGWSPRSFTETAARIARSHPAPDR